MKYLDAIRSVERSLNFKLEMAATIAVFVFGCCMGLLSECSDSLIRMNW